MGTRSLVAWLFYACLIFFGHESAIASELGHYGPAVLRTRDLIQPPPGSYGALYINYYTTDTFKDRNGDEVDQVTVGGVTVDIDIDIDSYMVIPAFLYVTDKKILGGNYGFFIMQPLGDMALDAAISTNIDRGIESDDSSFGLGDTYVQPLWLGWEWGRNAAAFGYGINIPVGKYDDDDTTNTGLGYWEHQFQGSLTHYFDDHKMTALVGALTYNISHNKRDADIRPGDRLAFNAGIDHMIPSSNKDYIFNIGVDGYGSWQVTEDNGSDVTRRGVKDRVYGAGLNVGVSYLPMMAQGTLHWVHEMGAEDRFEGDYFTLTVGMPF